MKKEIRTRLEDWQEEIMDKYNKKIKYYSKKFRQDIVDELLEEVNEASKVWGYDCIGKEGKEYYGINYVEEKENKTMVESTTMKKEDLMKKVDELVFTIKCGYEDNGVSLWEQKDERYEEVSEAYDEIKDFIASDEYWEIFDDEDNYHEYNDELSDKLREIKVWINKYEEENDEWYDKTWSLDF